jgi:hypothetical protein
VATVGDEAATAIAVTTRTDDAAATPSSIANVRFIPASLIGLIWTFYTRVGAEVAPGVEPAN